MNDCNGKQLISGNKVYVMGMNGNNPAYVVEDAGNGFIMVQYEAGHRVQTAHHYKRIVKRID